MKILEGSWDGNTSWEFYLDESLPDGAICTSVSCLALIGTAKDIVLTRNRRGWEMPGGHIEPGETLEDTLKREALEEGGYVPSRYRLYGYRRVSSIRPVPNDHHGGVYPPVTYIAHYIAETDEPLVEPTGPPEEIFGRRTFTPDEVSGLQIVQEPFIIAGLQTYYNMKNAGGELTST